MLAKKKKFSKKEMKEDKLVTAYYDTISFVQKYQNQLLGVFAGIAIVIFAGYYYVNSVEENNAKASEELSKVLYIYEAGLYSEAIDGRPGTDVTGLKSIVENYSGTENGEAARIYLANCYYYTGEFEKSIEEFKDYSGDNGLFKAAALAGVAACKADMDDFEAAGDNYLDASAVNEADPWNSEYLLKAGINYLKAGNKKAAKDALTTIKEDYPTSTEFSMVDRYLVQCS